MPQPRILIIEDERGLTQSLTWYFNKEGFEVAVSDNGLDGLRKAQTTLPDVVLLDLMLPGVSGLDVCRELRAGERTRDIPVIITTAKSDETDQVVGYSFGADDYVTKPFSNKILLSKVKALLRRAGGPAQALPPPPAHRGVTVDAARHRATFEAAALDLTPTEFRLLECLVRQPGRAFTRKQLVGAAIGDAAVVLERAIDGHIRTLRQKLAAAGGPPDLIETARGLGYRFAEGASAPAASADPPRAPGARPPLLATVLAQVCGAACHDLLNCFTALGLELEQAEGAGNGEPLRAARALVGSAHRTVDELHRFVGAFYAPSADEGLVPPENLRSWLQENVSPMVAGGARLTVRVGARPPVGVPGILLRVIFGGLVRNALEARPAGGRAARIRVALAAIDAGRGLRCEVSDNGPGWPIDPEELMTTIANNQPFTTKGAGRGHGLRTIALIARRLGGAVALAAAEPTGAAVTVRFPWHEART